ncbi:antibiotic biosynthesis monooxygenase family protein [Shewanella litorisediminis]|uniref:Antibiotic biosynthesis monooxygenase n=1 Tax=Shewanella litorisediminis TaxID=1173586 RepID=A0ABX7G522_9GAMM|nr:antibiotic biosynthesis monooxygenase [Shewanella litorisediminis]MCL2918013.1 antibiotic biosynthesis monooxygenase [Shewanella litorisediminis]QRH02444.1 antibiotic biosynthesis monooxygenase [Shewanella litorisediminis]
MYAVIFKATVSKRDNQYSAMAAELRQLAFEKYGCRDFIAVTEGAQEIAISYWDSEADILAWKQDALHRVAQQTGAKRWYQSYQVEVLELKRSYRAG